MVRTSRKAVYKAIEKEIRFRRGIKSLTSSIKEYVALLGLQLNSVHDQINADNSQGALVEIRKLAADAVECLQKFGAPKRSKDPPIELIIDRSVTLKMPKNWPNKLYPKNLRHQDLCGATPRRYLDPRLDPKIIPSKKLK
ncbi:MAG: hypothetical protein Q8P07_02240 [bacterium]|nr:hypothetical protein [bacterium]